MIINGLPVGLPSRPDVGKRALALLHDFKSLLLLNFIKMPVTGLPMTLERLINSILEESNLSSFKVVGNQERTTLVLRFEVMAMADMSMSAGHHSTPASFRRKSPSQIRRDQLRKQQFPALSTTETATTSTNKDILEKKESASVDTEQTNYMDLTCSKPNDSAIHSASVSTAASPLGDTPVVENTLGESNDLLTSVTETKHGENGVHMSDTSITSDSEPEVDDKNTSILSAENSTTQNQQGVCSNSHQASLADRSRDTAMIQQLDCDTTRAQIFKIKKDTGRQITHPDRNNRFLKLVVDTFQNTRHAILAETEDLIIEYCVADQKVTNFIVKNSEDDSSYAKMRQRHLRQWQDQEFLIMEDFGYEEHVQNMRTLLPYLKLLVAQHLNL